MTTSFKIDRLIILAQDKKEQMKNIGAVSIFHLSAEGAQGKWSY